MKDFQGDHHHEHHYTTTTAVHCDKLYNCYNCFPKYNSIRIHQLYRISIIKRLGVEVRLFPIGDDDVCDCVSLALWLRNLAYQVRVARFMKQTVPSSILSLP